MVRQRVDLLILGSQETVTIPDGPVDDLGIIDGGGVAVKNGVIHAAASTQLLERKYSARTIIDASGETILPGFVDPHTHLVFKGSREDEFHMRVQGASYMEVLRRGGGIVETVNRTRQTGPEELLEIALRRLDQALESGTTTIEIKSGYGLSTHDELKILSVIKRLSQHHPTRVVPTFLGAHAVPRDYSSPAEYLSLVMQQMLPLVVQRKLARFCDVFCENGAFDDGASLRILKAGAKLGLEPKIHADEFSNSGGAKVANVTGAASADHLVHSPMVELERMIKTRVIPVLLPASSQSLLMTEYAPAREMLKMGLPVALGTDFSPANWALSQLTVAAVAARELRMKTEEIIRGITVNAARALGLEKRVGSITLGKAADLAILRAPNHKWVGYSYADRLVDKVLIGGRLVVEKGSRIL